MITRYSVWLLGRRCFFECNKIKEQLGWSSTIGYEEGIPAAVQDLLKSTGNKPAETAQPTREPVETAP
jgi:nucleoside-diphosphate-sugar epimerase